MRDAAKDRLPQRPVPVGAGDQAVAHPRRLGKQVEADAFFSPLQPPDFHIEGKVRKKRARSRRKARRWPWRPKAR